MSARAPRPAARRRAVHTLRAGVVLWSMPHASLGSPASLQSPSSPKSHDGDRRSRGADPTENTDLDEGFHPDMTVEERQL